MSSVNVTSGTGIDAIAEQLMKVFDQNKDGKLSTAEFTSVLNGLLNSQPANATVGANGVANSAAPIGAPRSTAHLAGFVPEKLVTGQSIKYKFGRAAMDFSVASVHDKASAEALLNQMRPAFQREGLEILQISKDKIQVNFEGQPLWIDVIQNAGTGATNFQWLPEGV